MANLTEKRELVLRLRESAKELFEKKENPSNNVQDVVMLDDLADMVNAAWDLSEDTMAVIDWIRKLTVTGRLGELVMENS